MSFLPESDRRYLASKGYNYEEVEDQGNKAVVLKDRTLPANRYDVASADILIVLPSGYPDVAPDMFYLMPWVKLVTTNRFPDKADHPFDYAGRKWQRWSRHNSEWRVGIDGLWTMIKRIEFALEKAA